MNLERYSKAIAAATGAISVAVADGVFDASDAVTTILAVLTVLGVWAAPANATEKG